MNTESTHNARAGVREVCERARVARGWLATSTSQKRNDILAAVARGLIDRTEEILIENGKDCQAGREAGMAEGLLDRLALSPKRVEDLAQSVIDLISLPDPVGEIVSGSTMPTGLRVRRVRVPLGVVGMIYEARPNVTVDAACLCIKSGNAAIVRGGSAALNSNRILVDIIRDAIASEGGSADLVASVDQWGREGATELMRARGLIDALVPRGGAGLIRSVVDNSIVPVIETGVGNCHIYVDASADLEQATPIVMNAKTQRVGVCNAVETLLIDYTIADTFLPVVAKQLIEAGVTLHADETARQILEGFEQVVEATESDWETEYLSYDLAVRIVSGVDEAVEHIRTYSSGHTEAVLANDTRIVNTFVAGVDSAAVAINASTRFTDGGQLGLGAELGISTQKLHARGPMGLTELTTWTWIIEGDGHIRA
ncbi:MAG: glutamate-5-semialdehyde dehydrogenase [Actinomycetaceae bacterium]|nr:glutamate-5-semialdehyde dehydrogenase [Actinomycetaceae bacterium]